MKKHIYYVTAVLMMTAGVSFHTAQGQYESIEKKAESYYNKEDYHNAAQLFEELIFKNYNLENSYLKGGISFLFLSKPEKGLNYIKKARTPENEVNPNYNFWLGRAYHLNMKMDSALMGYRKYLAVASQNDEYRKGVEELIGQIHRTEIHFLTGDSGPYTVKNVGENINSIYTEHSPLVTSDGKILVFTSKRPLFADERLEGGGEYADKLFYAVRGENGKWEKAQPLFPTKSAKHRYSAIQFIGGNKLLLYNQDEGGSLWTAEIEGDHFKEPVKSNLNIPAKYFMNNGAINSSLDRIVFVGNTLFEGTFDLFMVEKKTEAKWGKPWKLGRYHNSTDDDIAPFWAEDGVTLVYSSKGLPGLGGYDLYKTKYDPLTKSFSQPENFGYPINTPGNETHYYEVTQGHKKTIYISSARFGGFGETDIYEVEYNPELSDAKVK
jgi:tetratricopeptide (TPR) repeat protein